LTSHRQQPLHAAPLGNAALLILSLLFLIVCVVSLGSPRPIVWPGDTSWFRAVAEQPLNSADFWLSTRAWAYPALLKIAGSADASVIRVQFVLHVTSHLFLAWAFFIAMRRSGAGLGLGAAVLAYGISPYVLAWSVVVLAESLAISLAAMFVGALALFWAWLDRESFPARAGVPLAVAVILFGILLSGTRDTWPSFLILVAAGLLLPARWLGSTAAPNARRKVARIVAAMLVATALFQITSARIGQRWRFGLTNIVLMQILPDPQAREHWVRAHGLPVDAELLRVAQTYEPGNQQAAFAHEPFQRWLGEHGMGAYTRELLGHPLRTSGKVLDGHRRTRNVFSWEYSEFQADSSLPARLSQRLLFHRLWFPAGLDFVVALLPCFLVLRYGPVAWRSPARVSLLLGLYLPFMSALGSLADPEEIYRHTLQVALGLRLLSLMGLVWLAAFLVRRYFSGFFRSA